jgi:type IV secretion system protein VirB4
LNFLLAQARKLKPRIIFFDKDRGAELFIRSIGGRYDVLRPGRPSDLNPLQFRWQEDLDPAQKPPDRRI